jgi:hypothetical protein
MYYKKSVFSSKTVFLYIVFESLKRETLKQPRRAPFWGINSPPFDSKILALKQMD